MKATHRRQLNILGAIALLFCAGGGAAVYSGVRSYLDTRAFVEQAIPAPGEVVAFEKWEPGTGANMRRDLIFTVVVYKTGDGREIRFRGPSKDGLIKLHKGDAVRVLYDAGDPQAAKIDSFMGLWFAAAMLCGIGAGAILIPLLTMWQAWKWAKSQEEAQ